VPQSPTPVEFRTRASLGDADLHSRSCPTGILPEQLAFSRRVLGVRPAQTDQREDFGRRRQLKDIRWTAGSRIDDRRLACQRSSVRPPGLLGGVAPSEGASPLPRVRPERADECSRARELQESCSQGLGVGSWNEQCPIALGICWTKDLDVAGNRTHDAGESCGGGLERGKRHALAPRGEHEHAVLLKLG
jgi:hypothetical protein